MSLSSSGVKKTEFCEGFIASEEYGRRQGDIKSKEIYIWRV